MKNGIAIVAGLFLMLSIVANILLLAGWWVGIAADTLAPYVRVVTFVMVVTAVIGLFLKDVWRHAYTWLGVW